VIDIFFFKKVKLTVRDEQQITKGQISLKRETFRCTLRFRGI
jgi:hypothetical protein